MTGQGALFQVETEVVDLYEWQQDAIEALRQNIRRGKVNQILAAPTGSGKTVMASYLIRECYEKGRRAVFAVDRTALVEQTSDTFDRYGIPHGIIQADHWRWMPHEQIQVASLQTLARRNRWPDADLIIVDECHTVHKTAVKRLSARDTIAIGLTATPFTRGLGKIYDAVVTVRTTNQLLSDGYLAPYRIFAPSEPDMTGAKVNSFGEWTEKEASSRAMEVVGDVVEQYLKHATGKKFIAFGADVKHCEELQRQFMEAGIVAGLYTYHTPDIERADMIRDFKERDSYLQGLISVAALAKGFDNPAVECVIMARPLRKSLAEHIQIMGRGLRRDPENPDKTCIILDHAGNTVRFWGPMNEFFAEGVHELDMGGREQQKKKAERREPEPVKCGKCAHVHPPRPACPMCGHEYPRQSTVLHVAGELNELTGLPAGTREDKQAVYSGLLFIARERGYSEGWAAHKYRERYGAWPNGLAKVSDTPSPALLKWVQSRIIAWAKAQAKRAA